MPIEEKESMRWLDALKATESIFQGENKKVITIADREADIYELFLLAEELKTFYLIRSSHNRKINKTAVHSDISGEKLYDFMDKKISKGKIKINVPAKDNQPKRVAKCSIKIRKIKMLPSHHYKWDKSRMRKLLVHVVQVVENRPPKGRDKINWILYTNIPTTNYDEAIEKIKWYCLRWRIEVYFKVIKLGFHVEKCRLETADRLIRYLSVISIVAWRVFWLTLVSRTSPSTSTLDFLSDDEWKILHITFNPTKKIPSKPPPSEKVIIWIARLGGFLARKNDGHPGITHIWRGLQKLYDLATGMSLSRKIYG